MIKWIADIVAAFFVIFWLYSGSVHIAIWTVVLSVALTALFGLWVLVRNYDGKKITIYVAVVLTVLYAVAMVIMICSVLSVPPGGCIL